MVLLGFGLLCLPATVYTAEPSMVEEDPPLDPGDSADGTPEAEKGHDSGGAEVDIGGVVSDYDFAPGSFIEVAHGHWLKSNASLTAGTNIKSRFSRKCNTVTGGGVEFVCPPGFHGAGKGICKLKAKKSKTGSDPTKYVLPTKKHWPNKKWGTVHPGNPTSTGHYLYKSGAWFTNGVKTEACRGGKLLNAGKYCLEACGKNSGYCEKYCGPGNACCAKHNPTDPEECQGLPGSVFKGTKHQCVVPKQSADVRWFADTTCHVIKGENCQATCGKVGLACDGQSFKKINSEINMQRAVSQAGLTCKSFTVISEPGTFKGPWLKHASMECGYHSGTNVQSDCSSHQTCDRAIVCPCKGAFITHTPDEQMCPEGYEYITDIMKCTEAAKFLKSIPKVTEKKGHFGTDGPAGCFHNPGTGHVNFNKDNTGTKVAMKGKSYVCQGEKSSFITTGNRQNECPEGYTRIKDKALCLAAGKELHPEASDGISAPYHMKDSPNEPNGCYMQVHEPGEPGIEHRTQRIYLNVPTLPGSYLHKGESLICMSEKVLAEINAKKAELTSKNHPQTGQCAPGYKAEANGMHNFGSCTGSWLTGYCVLPAGDAKIMCDNNPECAGVSETTNKAWIKANPGMQQLGKLPKNTNAEWKTCVKGPKPDPCADANVMNDAQIVAMATEPAPAAVAAAKNPATLIEVAAFALGIVPKEEERGAQRVAQALEEAHAVAVDISGDFNTHGARRGVEGRGSLAPDGGWKGLMRRDASAGGSTGDAPEPL